MFELLILIIICSLVGSVLGTLTGLIPGLHVNTVALILLMTYGTITLFLKILSGLNGNEIALLVAIIIVSTSLTHTFVDFIPSTFLGVPEEDTALSVLPAHKLLLKGKGMKAVELSAVGSLVAVVSGLMIIIPYSLILGAPGNFLTLLTNSTLYILLFLCSLLIVSETSKINGSNFYGCTMAGLVFFSSGILGSIVLSLPTTSPVGFRSTNLFPLFTGLFGFSNLVLSLNDSSANELPIQEKLTDSEDLNTLPAVPGMLAGSLVGFLPGVSSAHAAIIAMNPWNRRKDASEESVITTLGAVNTSNAVFVIVALFLTNKARSGAAVAMSEVLPTITWTGILPFLLVNILIAVLVSSMVAFNITLLLGEKISQIITIIPYRSLTQGIIIGLIFLVIIFNGILGLMILLTSTLLGMVPPLIGVRRSHLMGVLLIPVIYYFL